MVAVAYKGLTRGQIIYICKVMTTLTVKNQIKDSEDIKGATAPICVKYGQHKLTNLSGRPHEYNIFYHFTLSAYSNLLQFSTSHPFGSSF